MDLSVASILRMAVVFVVSAAFATGCAVAVTRLAVRTRFFSVHERIPDTWHGRRVNHDDREDNGLNPVFLALLAFWISFAVAMNTLDGLLGG
ncbi:hypothetical protein ACFQMA_18315 [Halosimplex aquaticum]|uniref:Uncharacterized protein n=1 Tax=Halosimplex aquaticum TaxID=3026162 RepID=A0ABD5Y7E0_9EURY|nr:hypothetical protein [Halosimplex aquaticum]